MHLLERAPATPLQSQLTPLMAAQLRRISSIEWRCRRRRAPRGLAAAQQSHPQCTAPGLGDSVALTKRLQSELMSLMASADPGVSAFPDGDSLFSWLGTIQGAAGTVYEGLSYKLSLKFPSGASSPAKELQSWCPKLASRISPTSRTPL